MTNKESTEAGTYVVPVTLNFALAAQKCSCRRREHR
jgi:hypothetical protein